MVISGLLGLDVGKKHIGVARASATAALAEPLTTIKTPEYLDKLKQVIDEHDADILVIGLPRNLQGDETSQTKWVRDWVDQAKKDLNMPFYWQDEALTSKLAELHRLSSNRSKNPIDDHAMAAAIILQDFLDAPETQRALC